MFNKSVFLNDAKEMFKKIFTEKEELAKKNRLPEPDFCDVLGEVIAYYFKMYNYDDVINVLNYDSDELEDIYEFDEENFDDYFYNSSIIKNYREALAYYSLNEYFITNCEDELNEFVESFK